MSNDELVFFDNQSKEEMINTLSENDNLVVDNLPGENVSMKKVFAAQNRAMEIRNLIQETAETKKKKQNREGGMKIPQTTKSGLVKIHHGPKAKEQPGFHPSDKLQERLKQRKKEKWVEIED